MENPVPPNKAGTGRCPLLAAFIKAPAIWIKSALKFQYTERK